MAIDSGRLRNASYDAPPTVLAAGVEVEGQYSCAACGYGISVRRVLPRCPMCGGDTWEPMDFNPLV